MRSWLDRCESVCSPDTDLLSADKVKLRNELLNVQVNYFSTPCLFLSDQFTSMSIFCFSVYQFYFLLTYYTMVLLLILCLIILKYLFTCTGNAEGGTLL